ncbi:MAG: nucleoside triphosphate pyrophosphohydrolase [candidate division WOR-3 bacterium]|nr:nucleoside triphosphate pyrophosphohydrolase [candidate division WOR-3 bacterium]
MKELLKIVALLRKKCPWDRKQTLNKIKPLFINEVYELVDKINKKNFEGIEEELGDLLLLIVFASQLLKEKKKSDFSKILIRLKKKIIYRHPHVFKKEKVKKVKEVIKNCENLKKKEKKVAIVDGIPKILPALHYAEVIQDRVKRVGFDWENKEDVLNKVEEEIGELKEAIKKKNKKEIENEVGDILFALVNLSRHLNLSAEESLKKACQRFIKRFKKLEKEFEKQGKDLREATLKEMDEVWEKIKKS